MAEPPVPSRAALIGPRVFPALPLDSDSHHRHLRRRDAQIAVDHARRDHIAARRALMAAAVPVPRGVRSTAVDAAAVLRAAVEVLAALSRSAGDDAPATVEVVVDSQDDGRSIVVRPRGELDMLNSPQFEQACAEQLDTALPDRLTVDLSGVTFLDSSAMAVLIEIRRVTLESGTTFALTGLTATIRRLLELTRLDTVFEIV